MKKDFLIITVIALTCAGQLFASDTRIKVSDYITQAGEYVIHASAEGKPIELLCDVDSPYCSPPVPGEYWMADWTVPMTEYRGDYKCGEVDLFQITAKAGKGRKVGEFCEVEK